METFLMILAPIVSGIISSQSGRTDIGVTVGVVMIVASLTLQQS